MDNERILHVLLTKGVVDLQQEASSKINLPRVNSLLRTMDFEAVKWPSPPQLILKNLSTKPCVLFPWTESSIVEAKKAIVQGSKGNKVDPDIALKLERGGWITRISDGRIQLTPRALVQFADIIEEVSDLYVRCEICGLLAEGQGHSECREL